METYRQILRTRLHSLLLAELRREHPVERQLPHPDTLFRRDLPRRWKQSQGSRFHSGRLRHQPLLFRVRTQSGMELSRDSRPVDRQARRQAYRARRCRRQGSLARHYNEHRSPIHGHRRFHELPSGPRAQTLQLDSQIPGYQGTHSRDGLCLEENAGDRFRPLRIQVRPRQPRPPGPGRLLRHPPGQPAACMGQARHGRGAQSPRRDGQRVRGSGRPARLCA